MDKLVPTGLREARERSIAILSEHFAQDRLDLEEFERRLSLAHAAEQPAELEPLTADLPPIALETPAVRTDLVPAAQVRPRQTLFTLMGGVERRGTWIAPRKLRVFTIMGGASLDFREARLPSGVVDISVMTIMGGVDIVVPPGLAVEVDGHAVMGGFDEMHRAPVRPDADAPLVRVHGVAVMGGVSVETRLPGESERDARRRRRKERRDRRATERRALPEPDER